MYRVFQFVLTSTAQENVVVKQLVFTGSGSLIWNSDVVSGSVRLYQDASGMGFIALERTACYGGGKFQRDRDP